jgi:competence protein ComGC
MFTLGIHAFQTALITIGALITHGYLGYEIAVLLIVAAAFAADRIALRRQAVAVRGQAQLVIVLGVFLLMAVLLVVAVVNINATKTAAAVKGCMSQEQSIATALLALNTATGTSGAYANKTVAAGILVNGTTDYLPTQPLDPVDNTSTYTLNATLTNGVYSYTITCAGVHGKDDLSGAIKSGTYSAGHIIDTNGSYSYN